NNGRIAVLAVAFAVALAIPGCGGKSTGGGSSSPPATGVVTVYPQTAAAPADSHAQVQFSAFFPSQPAATFTWSITSGSGNGTIDANTGLYTPPSAVPNPATVTITATDTAASGDKGTATITIVAAPGVIVSPAALALPAGATANFSATVAGNPVTPAWQVNGIAGGNAAVGTITAAGAYTAPLTPPPGGSVTITASSGANSGTATATVVFSNSSLTGSYAFSYSGGDSNGGPLAVAGSFTTAPAAGTLNALEDYNSAGATTVAKALPVTGTYQVFPDGSGSATLNNPAAVNSREVWQFTLAAGTAGGASRHALLVRFDGTATGSGSIDLQNTAQLKTLASISGNYVFGISGIDAVSRAAFPLQFAGIFNTDGAGNIPLNSGEEDVNDGGHATPSNAPDLSLNGTYSLDTNNLGSGRGYITLNNTSGQTTVHTVDYAFYMVDSAHLKLVEIDNTALLSGDAYAAPNTAHGLYQPSSFSGHYVFTLGGTDLTTSNPFAQGGVVIADGNGGITGGVVDVNDGGKTQLAQSVASASYTVDASLGRIALPIQFGNTVINYAAYLASNGSVEIISLDRNFMDSGVGFLQASATAPRGAFALNLSGVIDSSQVGAAGTEEDVAGQMNIPASGAPAGNLDINNSGTLVIGSPLGSSSNIGGADANGRGTASVAAHVATFPLIYYAIDANNVLLFESDATRTMVGALARQY
ncbi:MAG: hypothetical protein KGL02_09815, partial [Acidobacteriota bacterium]|nr:hypothetical protein [Acidobacteriota bacterium]